MTKKIDIYEVHVQPLKQVKEDIENNFYQCISCLDIIQGNFKKVLTVPESKKNTVMAEVYTCEHCMNITIAASEAYLGKGNTEELMEYGTVHAEWHNEF